MSTASLRSYVITNNNKLIICSGMLIAGELYIHFKDKTVQDTKSEEMFQTLIRHIPNISDAQQEQQEPESDEKEGKNTYQPIKILVRITKFVAYQYATNLVIY